MKSKLTRIAGTLCLLLVAGCLQGFEDHSRFDIDPPVLGLALTGNLPKLKRYVETGADINVSDNMGNTLLMLAVVDDHVEFVQYLLVNGADPHRRNKAGETALDISKGGKPKRVTKLLEAAMR